jgi:hypothetical protein
LGIIFLTVLLINCGETVGSEETSEVFNDEKGILKLPTKIC